MVKTNSSSGWLRIRLLSLIFVFLGISWVGIYYFYFFNSSKSKEDSFDFSQVIPLKTWKFESRIPLNLSSSKQEKSYQGYQYIYTKDKQKLTVEMIDKKYSGNINHFLIIHKNIPPATVIIQQQYQPDSGYYGLFEYQEKIYLTACLNPQGYSTLTGEQFTQNRYLYGGGIQRTLRWIIGEGDLFNNHCLWTLISLENQDSSVDLSGELKSIWLAWYSEVKDHLF